jgi:hypothetical protein
MSDILPACTVGEDNTKYFEYREWEGEMCRYFPYAGTYISVDTGKIRANDGGPKNFDGKALAEKRWADRRQAIVDGLTEADGTGAAKFIMGIMEVDDKGVKEGGAKMTIEMSPDAVQKILEKLSNAE